MIDVYTQRDENLTSFIDRGNFKLKSKWCNVGENIEVEMTILTTSVYIYMSQS